METHRIQDGFRQLTPSHQLHLDIAFVLGGPRFTWPVG
jgi:hypothetical protein